MHSMLGKTYNLTLLRNGKAQFPRISFNTVKRLAVLVIVLFIAVFFLFSAWCVTIHDEYHCSADHCPICWHIHAYRNGTFNVSLIIVTIITIILRALSASSQINIFHQKNTLFGLKIRLNN